MGAENTASAAMESLDVNNIFALGNLCVFLFLSMTAVLIQHVYM